MPSSCVVFINVVKGVVAAACVQTLFLHLTTVLSFSSNIRRLTFPSILMEVTALNWAQ